MNTPIRLLAVSSLAFVALACSAAPAESEGASDDAVETSQEALTACGSAKYAEAFAHYKNAVEWSKDRLRSGVCESDNGYLWSIADEASRAVMTCGSFRNVIKTSPWAAPLRTALAPSLTLRSLSGELLVIKNSEWANWSGVDRFFTSGGLSFWARAQGAYGSAVRIDFRANGAATWGEQVYDEVTGDITWRSLPATYTLTKTRESGPRTVTVKRAGKTQKFTLGVQSGWQYDDAPLFTLTPATTPGSTVPVLFSLVSECDA